MLPPAQSQTVQSPVEATVTADRPMPVQTAVDHESVNVVPVNSNPSTVKLLLSAGSRISAGVLRPVF